MNLFMAAGLDLPSSGGAGQRAAARMPRQPLFAVKTVDQALVELVIDPTPEQIALARTYAKRAQGGAFRAQKETAVRNSFFKEIMIGLLGYELLEASLDGQV